MLAGAYGRQDATHPIVVHAAVDPVQQVGVQSSRYGRRPVGLHGPAFLFQVRIVVDDPACGFAQRFPFGEHGLVDIVPGLYMRVKHGLDRRRVPLVHAEPAAAGVQGWFLMIWDAGLVHHVPDRFDHVGWRVHVERERAACFRAGRGHHAACRVDGGMFGLLRREPAWLLLKALSDDGGGALRVGHVGAGPDSTEPFEAWTAFDLVHGPRVMRLAEHGEQVGACDESGRVIVFAEQPFQIVPVLVFLFHGFGRGHGLRVGQ